MRKLKIIVVAALILTFFLAAMVNAQVSPSPGPSFEQSFVPAFKVPVFSLVDTTRLLHDSSKPLKMTLSGAEQTALRNLEVGKWVVVSFNFPPALNGKELVWSSSNPGVATANGIGNWGLVLGKGPGTATITVSTADGSFSYSFQVTVQ